MSAVPSPSLAARTAEPESPETAAPAPLQYLHWTDRGAGDLSIPADQQLAEETAVAISYNGVNHAVMMATPEDLEDYALGFSVGNGVVSDPKHILDVEVHRDGDTVCLDIRLNQRAYHALKRARRALAGNSGCGLCGVEAISQALAPLRQHRAATGHGALPDPAHLHSLRERIRRAQRHLQRSGAMHAAIYVDVNGKTLWCREDIGRHNAMDKLLGACLQRGVQLQHGFVAITSRCSLELVQKAVRAGVGTLVSLSAPTDMCVRWARENHLNLLHQPAQAPARLYSPRAIRVMEPV
ncbi:formate dehydrogenase accessory sulfurtransferase FdhD [Microbulbifer marinus]|uniref:Sulfur carrier protein FdhD n=1 Tax=Microbulbifer marinus TaxID=658218 RepID=A0A1H3W4U2_9GAMM|nr:formate dehydrogenase accessory sulfurtransferase FdhD [Microbulbifer marinus]SDZ82139.1 FdhD protein [Microbulbifer marinus]